MRVHKFSIGFGPAILTIEHRETIYQVAAVPFGGYVQIAGMGAHADDREPGSFLARPLWQRAAVVCAGPVANFALAAVVFGILFGTYSAHLYRGQAMGTNVARAVSGPAEAAGLRPWDVVEKVNGEAVFRPYEINKATGAGQPLTLTVARSPDGQPPPRKHYDAERVGAPAGLEIAWPKPPPEWTREEVVVTPEKDEKGRFALGISWDVARFGASGAAVIARCAVDESYHGVTNLLGHLRDAARGEKPLDLAGPVRVTSVGADRLHRGVDWFLTFLALVSVCLGLFNLLPLPALDGGRLLFVVAEGVARRPVPRKAELVIHAIGFLVLMGIVIVVTIKEIAAKF